MRRYCTPTFYAGMLPEAPAKPPTCRACCHLLTLCFLLSLPSSLVFMVRCSPALTALRWPERLRDATRIFPAGLELVLNRSTLQLRPSAAARSGEASQDASEEDGAPYVCWERSESAWCGRSGSDGLAPIRLDLGPLLDTGIYLELPPPLHISPAKLLSFVASSAAFEDELDQYPDISEYSAGEEVEVLHGPRTFFWGGGWQPATIEQAHPARDVRSYGYTIALRSDGRRYRKQANMIRRPTTIVLSHAELFTSPPRPQAEADEKKAKKKERESAQLWAERLEGAKEEAQAKVGGWEGGNAETQRVMAAELVVHNFLLSEEVKHRRWALGEEAVEEGGAEAEPTVEAQAAEPRGEAAVAAVAAAEARAAAWVAATEAAAPEEEEEEEAPAPDGAALRTLEAELLGLRAAAVLLPDQVHILRGYSFHYTQYWQFRSSSLPTLRSTQQRVSAASLRSFKPLALLTTLCESQGPQIMVCSRETARRQLAPLSDSALLPHLGGPIGLHAVVGLGVGATNWMRNVLFMLPPVAFVHVPLAYIAANLLRHVDTPLTPVRTIGVLCAYSVTPFLALEELLDGALGVLHAMRTLRRASGTPLPDEAEAAKAEAAAAAAAAAAKAAKAGAEAETEAEAGAEAEADAEAGAEAGAEAEADLLTTSIGRAEEAIYLVQDAQRLRLLAHVALVCYLVYRLRADEKSAQHAARNSGVTRRAPPEAAEVDDEPTCRICFAGSEAGQLVSPCLCSGSMRFVHLDCLTQWRTLSTNPKSHYQCENCLYKYSFRRALWASVLRSALVLHVITLFVLGLILFLCSMIAQHVDRTYFHGTMATLALESELLASLVNPAGWFGVDPTYVLASVTVIGISGFLTLGMLGPMLWPGRGQHDTLLVVVVAIGLARTFLLIYDAVKHRSARLLQEAEKLVVDVGDSPPPPPPPPPPPVAEGAPGAPAEGAPGAPAAADGAPAVPAASAAPAVPGGQVEPAAPVAPAAPEPEPSEPAAAAEGEGGLAADDESTGERRPASPERRQASPARVRRRLVEGHEAGADYEY